MFGAFAFGGKVATIVTEAARIMCARNFAASRGWQGDE